MAKDPAFLFYDGDAARDVSHMTRLERGAYFDLIQAQRKFGGYTVEQARKILGKDFEDVWPSLELILCKDDDGRYFIEWVSESIKNRKEHAEKQRARIQDYWDKKKKNYTTVIPRNNDGITAVIPLESEIESEIENESKKGNKQTLFPINFSFEQFWNLYDKKVGLKSKIQKKWEALSDKEREAAMSHIPEYKKAQPDKKFRKDPETYLNNKSFNDEIIPSYVQRRTITSAPAGPGGANFQTGAGANGPLRF